MLKAELLKYLEGVGDDEPLFLLRAQDETAPGHVMHWAAKASIAGVNGKKVAGATDCSKAMAAWQEKTGAAKLPD